jgi:hypothetical protein
MENRKNNISFKSNFRQIIKDANLDKTNCHYNFKLNLC